MKSKGRKVSKVIVKKSGSMVTFAGKRVTWSRIASNAKFYHEKSSKR